MYKILFLIRSLDFGGVERQLIELVRNMDHSRFDIQIVTFYDGGAIRSAIEEIPSVKISSLSKKGRWDLLSFSIRMIKVIKNYQPDVIQTYLDVPNSFGVIVGKLIGSKIAIGVSASYVDFSKYDWTQHWVYKTGALLSRFADVIIANSQVGKIYNIEHGYSRKKMIVIPNGIDTKVFFPDNLSGKKMRSAWGISNDEKVIGIVGRIDPMKDHENFLNAAAFVEKKISNSRFVCIGRGNSDYVNTLKKLSSSLLPPEKVIWIHDCSEKDLPGAYNAFDVLVSSSYGEGLPVVIGEGMSSGIPCVVTNVGDSALAIGNTGISVPPKNPVLLAQAVCDILTKPDQEYELLCFLARNHVEEQYSIEKMTSSYESTYETLARK